MSQSPGAALPQQQPAALDPFTVAFAAVPGGFAVWRYFHCPGVPGSRVVARVRPDALPAAGFAAAAAVPRPEADAPGADAAAASATEGGAQQPAVEFSGAEEAALLEADELRLLPVAGATGVATVEALWERFSEAAAAAGDDDADDAWSQMMSRKRLRRGDEPEVEVDAE